MEHNASGAMAGRQLRKPAIAALVRGKDGRPRFDDIKGIPRIFWNQLTWEEQQDIINRGGYPNE